MPGFAINEDIGPLHTLESSRKHRYRVTFLGPIFDSDILLSAHKVGLPGIEFDRMVMHHGSEEIFLPGKIHYSPIEITFYRIHGAGSDTAAQQIHEWWANQFDGRELGNGIYSTKRSVHLRVKDRDKAGPNKATCQIDMLDGLGRPVYKYHIFNCWPSKVSPDSLDYSDSAILSITITLQYDKMREEIVEQDKAVVKMCEVGDFNLDEVPFEEEEGEEEEGEEGAGGGGGGGGVGPGPQIAREAPRPPIIIGPVTAAAAERAAEIQIANNKANPGHEIAQVFIEGVQPGEAAPSNAVFPGGPGSGGTGRFAGLAGAELAAALQEPFNANPGNQIAGNAPRAGPGGSFAPLFDSGAIGNPGNQIAGDEPSRGFAAAQQEGVAEAAARIAAQQNAAGAQAGNANPGNPIAQGQR